MKKRTQILAMAMIGLLFAAFTFPDKSTAKVDPSKSSVNWVGKKVTGQHTGTVQLKSGSLELIGDEISGGTFTADMGTIKNTDMKGEMSDKLVGHLNSPDFFSVADFGMATFTITKVAKIKADKAGYNYTLTGNMEIKGITQELTFKAKVEVAETQIIASADLAVDRTKHEIRYGSGSFFDDLGDKTIDDNFMLTVNLVANRK